MTADSSHSPVRKGLAHLAIFGVVSLAYVFGFLEFIECKIADLRFELLRRGVTNDLVLVEIDARSLRALDGWPWPRSYHAQIANSLTMAGADRVAFDVDFSSHSTQPGDAALAEALAAADNPVLLPVFAQMMRGIDGDEQLILTRPLPQFEQHATLGSVNVMVSGDALVRRAATIQELGDYRQPAFFSVLAGLDGGSTEPFFIDYGIRPEEITRLSYADVLLGRFDPRMVAGRRVLIGATAMELGDEVAVPVHGNIPGSVLQALAYESLVQGRTIRPLPRWLILGVTLAIVGSSGWGFARWSWRRGLGVVAGGSALIVLASLAVQAGQPITVDVTPWLLALALTFAMAMIGRIEQLDLRLLAHRIALRRTGAFMRQVVDNSHDGIVTIDGDGRIRSLNRAAEGVLGSPAEHVLGLSFYALVASGTWRGLVPESELYAQPHEIRRTRPDGTCSAIQVSVSLTVVEDEPIYIAMLRDITQQKRAEQTAEESKIRLHEAIGRIHEGFALYDPEGNLALSNEQFDEIAARLPVPTDRVDLSEFETKDEEPEPYREIVLDDGTCLRVSHRPTKEGGAVAVYADITELKQREAELRVAVRESEAANRSKTEFLSNMSHELRTPLNAIIGFSETMVTELMGPVGTPQYKEYAGDILSSGQHLLDIISDILDVSKIEAGELRISSARLKVDAVVEDALRMIRERAASSGHSITTGYPDDLPDLKGDRRAILQVLLNLLSNAMKFSKDGGEIAVTVRAPKDGTLTIAIADTGIGMAEDDVPRALSLFGQIESSLQRTHDGTGLGLPLSERLMELHQGSLAIESVLGEGTTVTLEFPADRVIWPAAGTEMVNARAS